MMSKKIIQGLIAAPFTPMHSDGSLHVELIPNYYSLLQKNGVNGVFICGTNGEGISLTINEKKAVAEAWAACTVDDASFTVLQLVGGNSIEESKELAIHAQSLGLDGIAFISPNYFKPATIRVLAECCAAVAAAVPEMPFFYYHIPQFTGVHFSMLDLLREVHSTIPNFAGIKYSHDDLDDFAACVQFNQQQFSLFWGRDQSLLSALKVGAKGGVGSTYNYAAPLYTKMMTAYQGNEIEEAIALQKKSIDIVEILSRFGGLATGKSFMRIIGLDCGEFRLPVKNMTPLQFIQFKEEIDKMELHSFFNQYE